MEGEVGGACGMYGEKKNAYKILVEKPEGKTPLGRPIYRWEDKVDLKEIGLKGMDWIIWLRIGQVAGHCEYGDECLGFIRSEIS
jgi:hypothetical protein